MSERHQDIGKVGSWAVDRLAIQMGQQPQAARVDVHGDGLAYSISMPSESQTRGIEFFEEEQVVRITTQNLHVELFNARAPRPARDGILVEDAEQTTRVLFLRDGHVAIEAMPPVAPAPLESPVRPASDANHMDALPSPTEPQEAVPEAVRAGVAETSSTPESREKQPRVRLQGRVGKDVRFSTGKQGETRVNFEVHDQATDVWERVYSTGGYADKVRESGIAGGDRVSVVGFRQQREVPKRTKDGQPYTATEERIYALTVKRKGKEQDEDGS